MNDQHQIIFNFNKDSDRDAWKIVNDDVMGGQSECSLMFSEDHASFSGQVSIKNNGGFCMIQYTFAAIALFRYQNIVLRLKGDGNRYQVRIKNDRHLHYSYVRYFKTSGEWESITIPLEQMYPVFRGDKIDVSNFDHDRLEHVGILIGNGKEEDFTMLLDYIKLT